MKKRNTIWEISTSLKAIHFSIQKKIFLTKRRKGLLEKEMRTEPKKYADKVYYYTYQKHINWEHPVLFDEKLAILKTGLYRKNALVVQCADKYRVREYVKECGLQDTLTELYGVWTDYKDIDISKLPDRFVLKRNNDSGGVIVVKDKKKEDHLKEKIEKMGQGMTRNYGLAFAEYQYQYIEPRYICEQNIESEDGKYPYDYRFFVMNGKARYIQVVIGSEVKDTMVKFMTDMEFRLFPVMLGYRQVTAEEIPAYRPKLLDEMISIAERLAEPFPFVRVDLYEYNGKVMFGELTFTPMGAMNWYINSTGQELMGNYLDVSEKSYSSRIVDADLRKKSKNPKPIGLKNRDLS